MRKNMNIKNTTVSDNEDGSMSVTLPSGSKLTMKNDGSMSVDLSSIKWVGVRHLAEVTAHHITETAGSTSHVVKLICDGEVRFAYNDRGQLIELSGTQVGMKMSKDNEILYYALTPEVMAKRPPEF